MRQPQKKFVALRDLLTDAIKFRPSTPEEIIEDLSFKWPDWLPEPLSRKSRPLKIIRHQLWVGVDGSSWAQELEFVKLEVLKRLRDAFPAVEITEIRCQIVTRPALSI